MEHTYDSLQAEVAKRIGRSHDFADDLHAKTQAELAAKYPDSTWYRNDTALPYRMGAMQATYEGHAGELGREILRLQRENAILREELAEAREGVTA